MKKTRTGGDALIRDEDAMVPIRSLDKPTLERRLASVQAKLARARAALKAIRTVSTAITPKIRAEYATAIAEVALEMTK